GLVIKIMQLFGFKQLSGFKADPQLKEINWKSWSFDRSFLNELNQSDWKEGIKEFQAALPDSVIEAAVGQMPPEIFAMEGENFIYKLKTRRDELMQEGLEYYDYISRVVVINGTRDGEEFFLNTINDSIQIIIKDKKSSHLIYNRTFDKEVT